MEQGLGQVIFLALLIAVFYFLLIRPQKRRVEQHQKLVSSVDVGDEIVTIGGLYGTVTAIGDDDFELEPSPGTRPRPAPAGRGLVVTAPGRRAQRHPRGSHVTL